MTRIISRYIRMSLLRTPISRQVIVMVMVMVQLKETLAFSSCVRPMMEDCDSNLLRTTDGDDKIVGGVVADPGSTPWLVSLMDANYVNPVPFCGGTLLSHSWVLTSASCVTSYQNNYDNIKVVLGEYDLTVEEGWEKHRSVTFIALHPDYDFYTHHADVALLRLSWFVFYNKHINILNLPDTRNAPKEEVLTKSLYTIAGWGRIGETGESSPVIRVAKVPLLPREDCKQVYPDFTDTMLCAGNLTHGGLDSCQGDLGGALAYDGYIYGVASYSVGCGRPGYPGVYTNVRSVIEWICFVTKLQATTSADLLSACH